MAQLWDAFIQDYQNEIFDWSTRETLEIFWYYCQDGSKAVFKLLKENRKLRDKEIERLKDENAVLSGECIRDTKETERLKKENNDLILANKGRKALTGAQFSCMEKLEKEKEWLLDNMIYEKDDRQWIENKMQQALKEE